MRNSSINFIILLLMGIMFSSCSTMNKTQKGAVVGTAGGGAMGAIIGKASGNTAMGAIIGAAVGGTTGAIIGNKMDKQAEEIKRTVPDANVQRVGEGIIVEFSSNVLFGFDQSALTSSSRASLDKLVIVLNEYSDTNIEVQGHTDSRGSTAYNKDLSVKRASAVVNYLTTKGISGRRVSINGFGESVPKYDNNTKSGRDQNRRVEFLITANEKMKVQAKQQAGK
ncbi:OmpA family protein [Marivirga sp. S37H4]|uniref:OmpA family protein n=1 Tax=Marivirga aurantiaca TaxID=2802615 RepID=A0A934X0W7_9BACT|nr:OmpA family protein [Marivirga aurantiaca]MBK6266370.1 OmpA family protein [Marivirga aurantiaca]